MWYVVCVCVSRVCVQRYNTLKTAIAAQAPAVKPVVAWIIFMPAGFGDPDQVQISFAAYKAQLTQVRTVMGTAWT